MRSIPADDLCVLPRPGEPVRERHRQYLVEAVVPPPILELRELHLEMDRVVVHGYGWGDIAVPAFTDPDTEEEKTAPQTFDDEVLDRLFGLNAERATEEARVGKRK